MEDESKIKLRNLLGELFQFEHEDLDFGIYRVMNRRREEVRKFIEKSLLEEVNKQLSLLTEEEKGKKMKDLEELQKEIREHFGEDAFEDGELKDQFKNTPSGKKYKNTLQELDEIRVSEDLEWEVYNHIYSFFSRYYDNGDFVSKRRYGKKSRYVVPYDGEETLLHWANRDQYYVKSSEYFRRFSFKVDSLKANFRVVMPEEEIGNVKAPEKRFFIILQEKKWDYDEANKELNIYFEFRGLNENEKKKFGTRVRQENLNKFSLQVLTKELRGRKEFSGLFEREGDKTLLEKQLNKYTKRNTRDYFIHQDLKGFLERELDFYIKNEVLKLEDMEKFDKEKLDLYLLEAQVIRNVSLTTIDFLAQIENFQKKVWEKKKFIVGTEYVITLDKIKEYAGEQFLENILDEVLNNTKQLEEWKELLGIEVKKEKALVLGKEWKKIPIDTKHFDEKFKLKLVEKLSEKNDLDEILDGILIKSENWQALTILRPKFREKIKCVYIDPPYNTGSDEFLYKDNYRHSSWLTMMENRLILARELMPKDGVLFVSIDDNEIDELKEMCLKNSFYLVTCFVRKSGIAPRMDVKHIATEHDYVLCFAKDIDKVVVNKQPAELEGYPFQDEFVNERGKFKLNKLDRGTIHYSESLDYPLRLKKGTVIDLMIGGKIKNYELDKKIQLWPGGDPLDKTWTWRWSKDKVDWGIQNNMIVFKKQNNRWTVYFKQYQYVDNELRPLRREIPFRSLLLDFTNEIGTKEIRDLFGGLTFPSYPKPTPLIQHLIKIGANPTSIIFDFFAGSGTTGHATMKLNKEDSGKRKFLLVEMAEYFDSIIVPRMKKIAYSFNWKEGKPQDMDGIGVFFKYQYLEQYEGALENIEFQRARKKLPEVEDYFVKYMLDFETKQSKTFLNIEEMEDPFNYKLKIIENYETKTVNVDLVETFNYLIGLKISKFKVLNDKGRRYVLIFGEEGGRRTLIVWRSIKNIDLEKDKEIISEVIAKSNPEKIYVNGDCVVGEFRQIENEFKNLLF